MLNAMADIVRWLINQHGAGRHTLQELKPKTSRSGKEKVSKDKSLKKAPLPTVSLCVLKV